MKNMMSRMAIASLLLTLASATVSAQTTKTAAPGQIAKAGDSIVYGIAQAETLSSISQRFTGTPKHWAAIGKYNGIRNDRTIPIGSAIAIPAYLLPDKNAFAIIVSVQGEVSIITKDGDTVAAKAGGSLVEGTLIATADDGFIALQLKDGTTFALPPASNLQLSELRVQEYTGRPRTALTLQKGRITSLVTPFSLPKSQYKVQTPLAIAGVRGTLFRINFDGERSFSEVLQGTVNVAPEGRASAVQSRNVHANYGAISTGKTQITTPTPLPAPPQLAASAELEQRLPLRFSLTQSEAAAFRVGIFTDVQGLHQVAETRGARDNNGDTTQLRIADLADGDYYVHASAINQQGLEGSPVVHKLRLKARPFPPFPQTPGAKVRGAADGNPINVRFQWTDAGIGYQYHLQIAADNGFTQILSEPPSLSAVGFAHDFANTGTYFWRVATIAFKNGIADQGPWSDIKQFQLLPPQQMPAVSQGRDRLQFSWRGDAGQHFVFETSASPTFDSPLQRAETAQTHAEFPIPPAGIYYARLQSIDSDGYRGTYSLPQKFVVERRWQTGYGDELTAGAAPVRGN